MVTPSEKRPVYAALQAEQPTHTYARVARPVTIEVRLNIHGQLMLIHDEPFAAIPLWIRYKNAARQLEILFEDGFCQPLNNTIDDGLHADLIRAAKVTVIYAENNKAVEGWETILLNDTYQ